MGTLAPGVEVLRPGALPLGWGWSRSRAAEQTLKFILSGA